MSLACRRKAEPRIIFYVSSTVRSSACRGLPEPDAIFSTLTEFDDCMNQLLPAWLEIDRIRRRRHRLMPPAAVFAPPRNTGRRTANPSAAASISTPISAQDRLVNFAITLGTLSANSVSGAWPVRETKGTI
jgi:hypothetical protein